MDVDSKFSFGLVVFYGRDIDEYVDMFDLDLERLTGLKVLDCPSGPAAFAKQAAERGIQVTACDPMYEQDDVSLLRNVIDKDAESVAAKQASNSQLLHPEFPSGVRRRKAMEEFLQDYSAGREVGRYIPGRLPSLPFADKSFDLALSANLLFVYSDTESGGMLLDSPFDYAFHKKAITELIRVSKKEVRIYPLRGPAQGKHRYLDKLAEEFIASGLRVEVHPVAQRDIIGAEETLIISRP
jgi:hypothetical protein